MKKILLLIVVFIGLYLVIPKYEYIDDGTPDLLRFNKITGNLEVNKYGSWSKVVSKSVVRVERPVISYEEFMKGRENFQEFLQKADKIKK